MGERGIELADALHEVVGEGVVVVDEDDHGKSIAAYLAGRNQRLLEAICHRHFKEVGSDLLLIPPFRHAMGKISNRSGERPLCQM